MDFSKLFKDLEMVTGVMDRSVSELYKEVDAAQGRVDPKMKAGLISQLKKVSKAHEEIHSSTMKIRNKINNHKW